MKKQQMKITDMHEILLDEGYKISYTIVRNFVNNETFKVREIFIRKPLKQGMKLNSIGEKSIKS